MTTEVTTIDCPMCGEEIKSIAKKCKHCGEFLTSTHSQVNLSNVTKDCPLCGESVKATASKCKHCKEIFSINRITASKETQELPNLTGGMIGFSITSLVVGILGLLTAIDAGTYVTDEEAGLIFLLFIINLIFGILSIAQKRDGKVMAIIGLSLGVLSIL